ncbi:MAG: exodeoxyribonuclease VII large subunit [Epulopiscium sp. Nuni2H_MBin001]|nr:MAG: exodeoxyribonuclease VII large subunit [Epulopiscium sp. Nuni2H_MBin001]
MQRKVVSISRLNNYVSQLFEEDYILSNVWICGEVSNCKYQTSSGHIYFTLKDADASIDAVMFKHDAKRLTFELKEGFSIFARCRVGLYPQAGKYQAYVFEVERQGLGALHEEFEQLKQRLCSEGLFEHKRAIPKYPKSVGLITSRTGAALADMLQVAMRRNSSIPIFIYPSAVQGELACGELVAQIERANSDNIVDVLIVGRGGGSIEDLWAFNEEAVARAIAGSAIPIISAVGHEVDTTIADFVSDKRAATPSVAAELVFPSLDILVGKVEHYKKELSSIVMSQLVVKQGMLERLISSPSYKTKSRYFEHQLLRVDGLVEQLDSGVNKCVKDKNAEFNSIIQQLEKLSPYRTLARGYSCITTADKKLISSINDVEIGNDIIIAVADGEIGVVVKNIEGGSDGF